MGTLSTHVMIGPVSYSIVFQVLRIQSSFNLLIHAQLGLLIKNIYKSYDLILA